MTGTWYTMVLWLTLVVTNQSQLWSPMKWRDAASDCFARLERWMPAPDDRPPPTDLAANPTEATRLGALFDIPPRWGGASLTLSLKAPCFQILIAENDITVAFNLNQISELEALHRGSSR